MTSDVFKGLPPRVEIRIQDSATGSYPTIARTGDRSRQGNYSTKFDDTNTIIFNTSAVVNLPTRLDLNSNFLTSDLTTDLSVTGSTIKGLSDNYVLFKDEGEALSPFFEDDLLYEQGKTSQFYLTGSEAEETTLGFQSKLSSKTALRYQIPIETSLALSSNTSSIYYYDFENKLWERIREDLETDPNDGTTESVVALAGNEESKLFGVFGNNILTGSLNGTGQSAIGQKPSEGYLIDALSPSPNEVTGAMTRLSEYGASANHLLSPDINHPFLIEKIVVEFPISAGAGWLNDKTTLEVGSDAGSIDGYSAGGPCLTFSVQRQARDDFREIIASGTIVPDGDNFSAEYSTAQPDFTTPQGFLSFSTPHVVVSGTNDQFTGSVKMELRPHVSNGVIGLGFLTGAIDIGPVFADSYIVARNPFGRAMGGGSSGRSYFGKEFTSPGGSERMNSSPTYDFDSNVRFYNADEGVFSPYLLLPGDNLLFSISKFRPVHSGALLAWPVPADLPLTGAHEVNMESGVLNIVMYGSQIRAGKEYHDTLNQPLTSDAVHEAIQFNTPVVDQFDVDERSSFEGAYSDQFITGNLGDDSRGLNGSIVLGTTPQFSASLLRGVKMTSNERFFDSMMPRPDQIWSVDGFQIFDFSTVFGGNNVGTFVMGSRNTADINPPDTEYYNTEWLRAYPFESRYANIARTTSPLKDVVGEGNLLISSVAVLRAIAQSNGKEQELLSNTQTGGTTEERALKAFYGIGAGESGSAEFISETNTPTNYRFMKGVSIRGWKYGVLNGLPTNSSIVFRRDRFGQFRDMLEQRKNSKYYVTEDENGKPITPTVTDSAVGVSFSEIDPESTFCSNMSFEATSSLPYFDADKDDVGRNRGALPDVAIVLP
jgi:hypothetical protein